MVASNVYSGLVKEKEEAKRQYTKAKSKGQSAGHVAAKQRNTNSFRVAVNVAASSKVIFNLTYEELLERRLGLYQQIIHIDPGQTVRDLRADVYIRESRKITRILVPAIKNQPNLTRNYTQNPFADVHRESQSRAHVSFHPSQAQQREISHNGVAGQFLVQYDVERNLDAGEIQVIDGYFVHYFAPSGLQPVKKNVLFILDVSSSMSGTKISQTKDALSTILDDLREGDRFNIITFQTFLRFYNESGMIHASRSNVKTAKRFLRTMGTGGGTNINDAVLRGVDFLQDHQVAGHENSASLIIFLTDGAPTSGIINRDRILSNVRQTNSHKYTIFSLGFGDGADFPFLQKLSLQNNGFARKIFEDSDASLQLQGFYNEVSTPLLSDVKIKYVGDDIVNSTLTNCRFPNYFDGSELVVAGKLKEIKVNRISTKVFGRAQKNNIELDLDVRVRNNRTIPNVSGLSKFTERLWAYLTIKDLMNRRLESTDSGEKGRLKARALKLSLEYSFVTPLTSMIVTKPEEPTTNVGDLKDDDSVRGGGFQRSPSSSQSGMEYSIGGDRRSGVYGDRVIGRPTRRGYPRRKQLSRFADNDPHFIIGMNGSREAICFDLYGRPGQIYQLVYDQITGVFVNGLIVGKQKSNSAKQERTYFGRIAVILPHVTVIITPNKIMVNKTVHRWRLNTKITSGGATVDIHRKRSVTVSLGRGIAFTVVRHKVGKNHPFKVDFLGFYVENGSGLSKEAHGLIGQFENLRVRVKTTSSRKPQKGDHAMLNFRHETDRRHYKPIRVQMIQRMNMASHELIPCWHLSNNGQGLIQGMYTDYIVPKLTSKQMPESLIDKVLEPVWKRAHY